MYKIYTGNIIHFYYYNYNYNYNYNTSMTSYCVICCDVLGKAKTVTECGHEFCTTCLLNCVAKNTGTEEGTTRNLCPMCRTPICDEVEPDARFKMQLDDAREDANKFFCYGQQLSSKYAQIVNRHRVEISDLKEALVKEEERCEKAVFFAKARRGSILKMTGFILRELDMNTTELSHKLIDYDNLRYFANARTIQNSWRKIKSRRQVLLMKNRKAWNIYKTIQETIEITPQSRTNSMEEYASQEWWTAVQRAATPSSSGAVAGANGSGGSVRRMLFTDESDDE